MVKSGLEEDPADSDPDPDYDPDLSSLEKSTAPAEISKSEPLLPQPPNTLPIPRAGADSELSGSKVERDLIRRGSRFKRPNQFADFDYEEDDS